MAAILQSCSADQNSDGKGGWSGIKYQQRTHSWSTIMVYVHFPVWSPHCMWRQCRVNCACCFILHLLQCSHSHRTGEKNTNYTLKGQTRKHVFNCPMKHLSQSGSCTLGLLSSHLLRLQQQRVANVLPCCTSLRARQGSIKGLCPSWKEQLANKVHLPTETKHCRAAKSRRNREVTDDHL